MIHAICVIVSVIIFLVYRNQCDLNPIEITMSIISTFIFCVAIALRYATASESRILSTFQRRFSTSDNDMEYMI